MESGIYNFNILKKYIEDNRNKLNSDKMERYPNKWMNNSNGLNNLLLYLSVPIPTLNHIIDESKNLIINNSYDQKRNYETLKYSNNLLDIIMSISLKKKNYFQKNQENGRKVNNLNHNNNIEEKRNICINVETGTHKDCYGFKTENNEHISFTHNYNNIIDANNEKDEEEIKYYPGFCKQLGAKGRRCMLELIRKVYRENTDQCKNILSHKIKPPACISNLPFFNINMLWKLSYEFGVFDEALKIHKMYGQNAKPLSQYLKKRINEKLLNNNKKKDTKKKRKKIDLINKERNCNNNNYKNNDSEADANINNNDWNSYNFERNIKPINKNFMSDDKNIEKTCVKYNYQNNINASFFYNFKINNINEQYNKTKKRKLMHQERDMCIMRKNESINCIEQTFQNNNYNEEMYTTLG